jgi:spore maturation protein A
MRRYSDAAHLKVGVFIMAMAWIWTGMVALSVIFGVLSGNSDAVGSAALQGCAAAVRLCFDILGLTCLWCGVMEIMQRSGIASKLSALFRPILAKLFPNTVRDSAAMESISANVTANLLGLGNAATPLGIRAAEELSKRSRDGEATDDLCMLVILNTASIQLIPATIAAVRASAGSKTPFDILPAVWITSAASVTMGVLAAAVFRHRKSRRRTA